jgi:hypothetical protein
VAITAGALQQGSLPGGQPPQLAAAGKLAAVTLAGPTHLRPAAIALLQRPLGPGAPQRQPGALPPAGLPQHALHRRLHVALPLQLLTLPAGRPRLLGSEPAPSLAWGGALVGADRRLALGEVSQDDKYLVCVCVVGGGGGAGGRGGGREQGGVRNTWRGTVSREPERGL